MTFIRLANLGLRFAPAASRLASLFDMPMNIANPWLKIVFVIRLRDGRTISSNTD